MRQVTSVFPSTSGRGIRLLLATAFTVGVLTLPAAAQVAISAQSGLVNYVSGRANINGTPVSRGSDGLLKQMQEGDVFSVDRGAAEILLTPGAFLRMSEGGSVQMLDTRLSDTQVSILHGEAMVEVADLYDDNSITVKMKGGEALLEKKGVYFFNGDQSVFRVLDGKAVAQSGDTTVNLKKGRFVQLSPAMKVAKFDTGDFKNSFLYSFSENRSKRLAAANQRALRTNGNSSSSLNRGWIYSSWLGGYSFIPGAGRLLSPFGGWYYSNLSWLMYPGIGFYPYGYGNNGGMGGSVGNRQITNWGGINNPRAAGMIQSSGAVRSSMPAAPSPAPAAPPAAAMGRARGR